MNDVIQPSEMTKRQLELFEACVAAARGPLARVRAGNGWIFRDRFNRRVAVSDKELRQNVGKEMLINLVQTRLHAPKQPRVKRART